MEELLESWQSRYNEMKLELIERKFDLSILSDLIEYNILCVRALELHECICELVSELVKEA